MASLDGCCEWCCMLQDRDASLTRLRAVAKSTAERVSKDKASAAAQPLEASQRAVIRDLSLRVANLTRGNNQLKEERERAQVFTVILLLQLGSSFCCHVGIALGDPDFKRLLAYWLLSR